MKWVYDDGGRNLAGYKGKAGDCVVRSIAIATEHNYQDIYDVMNDFAKGERVTKRMKRRSSSRTGVNKKTARQFMTELGWTWVPTMGIGTGTTVHLRDGELPPGRLVVACSKHYTAVIDGVIHDTHDPSRDGTRAVYGYYHGKPAMDPVRDDPDFGLVIQTIHDGDTLKAMAWAREICKRHPGIRASEIYQLAKESRYG